MDINGNRAKIDAIDDEIIRLYDERMSLVRKIGEEKAKTNANVLDVSREKDIINRLIKEVSPDITVYVKQLYNTVFDTSKAYQSRFSRLSSNVGNVISEVLSRGKESFPDFAEVACQGIAGAYSYLAAERLFKLSSVTYFKDFEGVFNAVENGLCEYGLLPVENSSVGSVNAVYDLMKKYKFHIVKSVKLPVRHSLLAKKGAEINGIKEIISHEQALGQCAEFIKKHGNVKVTVCPNTALAAKIVSERNDVTVAAISSPQCAALYGLAALEPNIQDNDSNYTRFICISKKLRIFKGADKISVMVNLPHEPGSLNKLLTKFTTLGLNLIKLESRPLPSTNFEFMFYFDFEADIENNEVLNLISELDNRPEQFTFLGSYGEV